MKKLRAEIKGAFIDRGEIKEHILQQDLLDVHGNYEKGKVFAGSLGGQLCQIFYALCGLKAASQSLEKINGKKHPSELLTGPMFYTFILNFIKDLKNDSFQIMISQDTI